MTEPQWVAPGSDPTLPPPDPGSAARPGFPAGVPAPAAPAYRPPGMPPLPTVDFRPGIIPLRPLSLGDIYSGVIKAVRGNVAATVGLAFVTSLAFLVPTTALGTWLASSASFDLGSPDAPTPPPTIGPLGTYLPLLGTILASVLLTGFLAFVTGQAVLGRRVSAGETWQGTRSFIARLLGATVLTGLVTSGAVAVILVAPVLALVSALQTGDGSGVGGAILLVVVAALVAIPLGLFLATRLAFVPAAIVLERIGIRAGMKRSWRLTRGADFWRVLGIRLLTGLVTGLARQILTLPLAVVSGAAVVFTGDVSKLFVWQTVSSGVTALIAGSLTIPFSAGVDALLYLDQRIRREGLDVQLLGSAQAQAPLPPLAGTGRPGPA